MLERVYPRLTGRARQVPGLAVDAARDLGQLEVGTEHLLLSLLADHDGLSEWVLRSLGLEVEPVYATVLRICGSTTRAPTAGGIPFSLDAKCVLELANVEVDRRGLDFIATEHLLLGLVAELEAGDGDDVALRTLAEFSVTPGQIREATEAFVPAATPGLSWTLRRTPGLEFRGVRGAGWIDVLSLHPEMHLRRMMVRAAAVALDAARSVLEVCDLLTALGALPEHAPPLAGLGLMPLRSSVSAEPAPRDWTP